MTCYHADPGAALLQAVVVVAPVRPGIFREEIGFQFLHKSFDLLTREKDVRVGGAFTERRTYSAAICRRVSSACIGVCSWCIVVVAVSMDQSCGGGGLQASAASLVFLEYWVDFLWHTRYWFLQMLCEECTYNISLPCFTNETWESSGKWRFFILGGWSTTAVMSNNTGVSCFDVFCFK